MARKANIVTCWQCDGKRPCRSCSAPTRPGRVVNCEYKDPQCEIDSLNRTCDDLRRRNGVLEEVFDVLRSKPEVQALEILRRLRAGADIDGISRDICVTDDLLLQLSLSPQTDWPFLRGD